MFWSTMGLVGLLMGGLVALQLSETDSEREARARRQEEEYLQIVCKQGKKVCDEAQERIERRRQMFYFFGED